MRLVVECEVCDFRYTVKTHVSPDGNAYLRMTISAADYDCPNCGAAGGHFNYHITADMVRELWNEGGCSLMDAKKALQEAEGDMELARRLLLRGGR